MIEFEVGRQYSRGRDIHDQYGGQRQGGISTPTNHPVIFLFSGSGDQHGYYDAVQPNGHFRFFGEGQVGDMVVARGNAAVAQHSDAGKVLHLFESIGSGRVTYLGEFECVSWHWQEAPDSAGDNRQAIVFELRRAV